MFRFSFAKPQIALSPTQQCAIIPHMPASDYGDRPTRGLLSPIGSSWEKIDVEPEKQQVTGFSSPSRASSCICDAPAAARGGRGVQPSVRIHRLAAIESVGVSLGF